MGRGLLVGSIALLLTACAPEGPREDRSSAEAVPSLAIVVGTSGVVTTLASYAGGGRHPGVNAIDIGAVGGSHVWHQMDYLSPDIAGGWVFVEHVREPGFCSQWTPESPYYNGAKIYVFTFFYDVNGSYLGWHRAAYQHVDPYEHNMNAWWTWNNAGTPAPAWPSAHLAYGVDLGEGLFLGTVTPIFGQIRNGPGGALCTTGSHLHQEGDGTRAGLRWVGEELAERYHDLHYFHPAGGLPYVGGPPWSPPAAAPAEHVPSECEQLGYGGRCDGALLSWCDDGEVRRFDCATVSRTCAWQDEAVGFNCL